MAREVGVGSWWRCQNADADDLRRKTATEPDGFGLRVVHPVVVHTVAAAPAVIPAAEAQTPVVVAAGPSETAS